MLATCLGKPRLPPVGDRLNHAYISHVAVDGDNADVFLALLKQCLDEGKKRHFDSLLLGLMRRNPWSELVARKFTHVAYGSVIYHVVWQGESQRQFFDDDRTYYLDVATL